MGTLANRPCAEPKLDSGYQMVRTIDVKNFRCFRHLHIEGCKRLNLIVGDNGVGKTALIEAVFMALGSSSDLANRFRTIRGLDSSFQGTAYQIEEAIFGDLFRNNDYSSPVVVSLEGDGADSRTVTLSRGEGGLLISPAIENEITLPFVFSWKDAGGTSRTVKPSFSAGQIAQLPDTGEYLPNFFYFAANQTIRGVENAFRFSEMSMAGREKKFVQVFQSEYPWVESMAIQVTGGGPVIYAKVKGQDRIVPLPNVSGGINRTVAMMLAIASRQKSVMLVDEIEDGIYHKHLAAVWRGLLTFIREFNGQLFVSTHSSECITALIEAAGEKVDDIAVFRLERNEGPPKLNFIEGKDIRAAVEFGGETR